MELIVITPEVELPDELELVNEMLDAGLQRLHVRKPSWDEHRYREYILGIRPIHRGKVVVHGAFGLYFELGLGGVHLNTKALNSPGLLEGLSVPANSVSASFHSWQELASAPYPFGYVFISPVFDSISKIGYKAAIDLTGALELMASKHAENVHCPNIVGLGGVGAAQLPTLDKYGFWGAAVLGAIWASPDPMKAFYGITAALPDTHR